MFYLAKIHKSRENTTAGKFDNPAEIFDSHAVYKSECRPWLHLESTLFVFVNILYLLCNRWLHFIADCKCDIIFSYGVFI